MLGDLAYVVSLETADGGAATAAYVAAGVALIVGLVNPLWQSRRADKRLSDQLAHDLDTRQRDETVALIERAALALGRGRRSQEKAHNLWQAGVDPDAELTRSERIEHAPAVQDVRDAYSLLRLRFEDGHSLVTAFNDCITALDDYRRELSGFWAKNAYSTTEAVKGLDVVVGRESQFLAVARAHLTGEQTIAEAISNENDGEC